jgi:SAM-dependent methyltransferase
VSLWVLVAATALFVALRALAPRGDVDLTAFVFLKAPLDAARFALRRRLRWRRGAPAHPQEPKDDLFDYAPAPLRATLAAREEALRARYDLAALRDRSTRDVYRENLYVLDALDAHAAAHLDVGASVRAMDVGCKDFCYAFALERWLRHAGADTPRAVSLDGVEIDGYPVYRDLHSRADHAEAYARETGNPSVRFRVEDFLATTDRDLDVVFFWYPFVLRYAIARWGLGLAHFAPERLFARAADALRPGGLLVVVNHTREEQRRQREILDATAGMRVLGSWPVTGAMVDYFATVPERSVTLARRAAPAG